MIDVQLDGNRAIIDVREVIKKGGHPKGEIMKYVDEAPQGTVIEIHTPYRTQPLIAGLEGMGYNVIVNELDPEHFRILVVKF